MKRKFFWFITLFCLFVIGLASADEPPISITAQANMTTCTVGEVITVTYEINGGSGIYKKVNVLWQECADANSASVTVAFHQMNNAVAGSCSYAPTYDGIMTVSVHVTDSLGREEVSILPNIIVGDGESSSQILINISTNKAYVHVGEEITIDYSITGGSNSYKNISVYWYETATECRGETIVAQEKLSNKKGSCFYTPIFSGEIFVQILVSDTANRTQSATSPQIIVEREPNETPIQISTYAKKTRVQVGESVTIGYKITGGSGEYVQVSSLWLEQATNSNSESRVAFFYGEDIDEHTFIPQFTGKLSVTIHVEDSLGRSHFEYVPSILVQSLEELEVDIPFMETEILLPASLQHLKDQAFASTQITSVYCPNGMISIGSHAFSQCVRLKQIYIPQTVTSIADNAFEGCNQVVIFCKKNSTAYKYARTHLINYCLTD